MFARHIMAICASMMIAPSAWAEEERLPGPIPARVIRVVDGDTVVVRARIWLGQDVETSVRLSGIDTPEKRGKCEAERQAALQAEAFTAARAAPDSLVFLHDVIADKYGKRVVARILSVQGEDLGRALIAARLARPYDGGHKDGWCGN
ncbi:MAG: thermonuclease family protein [Magnetospirillum gryphiswaldense]|nr:thermonuclease family protein [Magnetospirillum gryphiswaldense]